MSQCKKFTPNIFHKSKCSNCFRQKEEHSAEALECNRASRSIARSGYLFVAPDWDFSVPLNRTKRWQRRWFVLYDDGELNYSVDEHPDTIPQGSVDMSKVLEVTGAEQVTGHPHSLALTSPDRVTFVKAASREDARWWAELLAVFPRRHKRNATFPGGRASPSLPQLGRSASPQPPRPRHLSVTGPSPRTNFETPPLKEERESPPKDSEAALKSMEVVTEETKQGLTETGIGGHLPIRSGWIPERTPGVVIENTPPLIRRDYIVSSGSPPTRDKLRCDDKARVRRDWRNERLRDIATALTDRSPESSLALPSEGLLHLKKGWLWLKTDENEWVRRWTVLCGPTLNVYQDQDEHGVPEISVELSTVTSYTEIPTNSKYGFQIQWAGPTLSLSAVTQGIRSNWMQALKMAAPMPAESPITPNTPKSILFSSDDEYRTASEGGRRESGDWSELPPSPPLNRLALRVKDRARQRPRLPRCQSRQSTLDSTSTDELDCAKDPLDNSLDNIQSVTNGSEVILDLQKQLARSAQEVSRLEEEITRLKKLQSEAALREKKAKDMLASLEKVEQELNQRNSLLESKLLKEQKSLQRRLAESEQISRTFEEKYEILLKELQAKQQILCNLQDELNSSNERLERSRQENDRVHKKLQELESRCYVQNNNAHLDSLTNLTNIDLDIDIEELGTNELKEYCLDLKCRFEKAVIELRAIKRTLRSSEDNCDRLEIANYSLKQSIELLKQEHQAEINLLVARLDHLTSKLTTVEKQLRLKTKTEGRDKRRSLSLKGRESFSINKEVEDKLTELEAKILTMEKNRPKRRFKRERSSERTSPIDDKSLRRLRRKSLDSATSSEPIKLLMRLSSLESKISSVSASNESLNITKSSSVSDLTRLTEEECDITSRFDVDDILVSARTKVLECLHSVSLLKNRRSSWSSDRLTFLESTLKDLSEILTKNDLRTNIREAQVVNSSAESVVKNLQQILQEKLVSLAEKKRMLLESGKLDVNARLQLLAEKVAFENILVGRIQEALQSPITGETICKRLIDKETKETAYLIIALQNKLNGNHQIQPPVCRTSADHLSKVLAKCLMSIGQGFKMCKNITQYHNKPSLHLIMEEQQKLEALLEVYKGTKLPQLAEALANEAYNLTLDKSCRIRSLSQTTVDEFSRTATEIVNAELIQSEINHFLLRAAQIYQSNLDADHTFFFSFFASERASLELWSDSVTECLYDEINKSISSLTDLYRNYLNKLQRQNWRRRVESERPSRSLANLLHEFADIVAHKALIDARINVLNGKCHIIENVNENAKDVSLLSSWFENEKYWIQMENQSTFVNEELEAEFACMLDKYSGECFASLGHPELEEIMQYMNEFQRKLDELQHITNTSNKETNYLMVKNWKDVCQKCKTLQSSLEKIKNSLNKGGSIQRSDSHIDQRPTYLGTEYITQLENLRAAYRCALASCKERHQETDIEQLQQLCEKVLNSMEQWHRRTIQELRESHSHEVEMLRQEKEQALAEETQATLAALDAMRKAHVAEVEREVARFKQEFARQQRDEIMDLSERLSVKSLEAAALEEQLGSATRQLAHAQQHILQLERNPQLSPMQN